MNGWKWKVMSPPTQFPQVRWSLTQPTFTFPDLGPGGGISGQQAPFYPAGGDRRSSSCHLRAARQNSIWEAGMGTITTLAAPSLLLHYPLQNVSPPPRLGILSWPWVGPVPVVASTFCSSFLGQPRGPVCPGDPNTSVGGNPAAG